MARAGSNIFFTRRRAEEAAADLPALMAGAERAVASVLLGEHTQRKTGAGERFWQFREYMAGDRPQDVDWRQSGKTDQVYIRQKEWQTPQATIFWCNRSAGMNFQSEEALNSKADAAKILTLAMALLVTRAGDQAGLFGQPRTGRSEAALERIGNGLFENSSGEHGLPDFNTYTCPKNSSLVMAGDFLEAADNIETAFKALSAQSQGGLMLQVLDPAEIDLPYSGRVIFEDPMNKARELVNHVSSVRDAYKGRIADHLRQVETLCRSYHWNYFLHRTDVPVRESLAAIWALIHHHHEVNPA